MRAAGGGTRAPHARGHPSLARRREQRRRRRRGQISILATSLAISALTSTLATSLATTALATAAIAPTLGISLPPPPLLLPSSTSFFPEHQHQLERVRECVIP